ncbi:MAG: hypothetical protein JW772_03300 [Candidatus Diapherotrites archaeon]|nr:hypothetical protein [Candidatus Diapherotrites archaeon]
MAKKKASTSYLLSVYYYFVTIIVLSFSTVVLVWGLLNQFENNIPLALLHYIATFLLIMVSRFFFIHGHRKLGDAKQ